MRPRWAVRCRANMAHIRQSRPDSGLGFQVTVPKILKVTPKAAHQQLNLETESMDGAMRMEQTGWRGEEGGSGRIVWAGWNGATRLDTAVELTTAVELGTYETVKARHGPCLAGDPEGGTSTAQSRNRKCGWGDADGAERVERRVGGGDRIDPGKARKSG